jgi:hypothetical protein
LIEVPDADDERTLMRMLRDVPAVGDLIDVEGESVLVTGVDQIPPRRTAGRNLSVLIYCRKG